MAVSFGVTDHVSGSLQWCLQWYESYKSGYQSLLIWLKTRPLYAEAALGVRGA